MSSDIGSELIGSWRLVSFSTTTASGETTYLMGRDAQGRITYEGSGRVAVQLADPNCAAFAQGDPRAATNAEVRSAFDGYLAYYGTYTVHADQRTVVHHLEMCSIPNWRGSEQVRYFDLQEGQLTLSTPPILLGGAERVSKLVWVKLP
jgi:hypothetical protein